jgi:hypothetical protein
MTTLNHSPSPSDHGAPPPPRPAIRRQESSGATEGLGAVPTGFDELEWEAWVKERGEGAEEIDRSR